jgi:hypothetical protein
VAGILAVQSGTPVDIQGGSALRAPGNQQRPDLNGSQNVIGDIGPGQQYFDKTVYVASAPNTFGNMTRNSGPRGPGYANLDASLVKRIHVSDRIAADLRVDAFNATNSPHFNNPGNQFGSPTFGQVNTSFGERFLRFGVRLTF